RRRQGASQTAAGPGHDSRLGVWRRRRLRPGCRERQRSGQSAALRNGPYTIFKLNIPGVGEPANLIIKDWQTDPVKGRLRHADLMRLSMTVVTRVSVPIVVVGEPVGVKLEGGILEINLREIEIECLPGDIPASLELDVADLHLGKHASVVDLKVDRTKIKVIT